MAATTTTLQLGQWNTLNDSFVAHPASPTGSVINLNDGTIFVLVDDSSGMGRGLNWGKMDPTILDAGNVRTVGRKVIRRVYDRNREVTIKLLWSGLAGTWTTWVTNLHNLVRTLEGISEDQPAALQFSPVGSSTTLYFDVRSVKKPTAWQFKELMNVQLLDDEIEIVLVCKPFLRGARQLLANGCPNPGLEAPSGAGVNVFSDSFATTNAYVDQVYPATVLADTPLRYYRLSDAIGATTVADLGSQNQAGTVSASGVTFRSGVGVVVGVGTPLFNGTSGDIVLGSPGTLPTGNSAWTLETWCWITALPSATVNLLAMGTGGSSKAVASLQLNTSGDPIVALGGGGSVTSATALTTGAWHHVAATYDGTTLTLYQDGASVGSNATFGPLSLSGSFATIAASAAASPTGFFSGYEGEVAIYSTALSSARVSAHYTAGHTTGNPSVASSVLTIPTGGRVAFGSPAWGAVQTWQVRFQAATGMTAQFYPHFTNATNFTDVIIQLASWSLNQEVAGTNHQLATASITLTNGTFYWLQVVQFPTVSGNAPQVQATLSNDSAGSIGSVITNGTLGPVATFDAVTALVGQPQISVSGAALAIGGAFSNVHTVNLFGPGGWLFVGNNGGTGLGVGAWDGGRPELGMSGTATLGTQTYPNGPVTSFGAARIDAPPTGTVSAYWSPYIGGAPAGTSAIPVQTGGNVVQFSVWVRQSGLSATASVILQQAQFNSGGTNLSVTTNLATQTAAGLGSGWTQMTGSVVTNAACAYCSLALLVTDSTSGASANATVWIDNCQVWDQTRTGMTTMPYCELRFPQSPAQLVVSGILGDVSAPALAQIGLYFAAWNTGHSATLYAGRRKIATPGVQLVTSPPSAFNASFANMSSTLDSTSYGGFYTSVTSSVNTNLRPPSLDVQDATGVYHTLGRLWTNDVSPTAVSVRIDAVLALNAWPELLKTFTSVLAQYYSSYVYPFASASTWTIVDSGQLSIPMAPLGTLSDPTKLYVEPLVSATSSNSDTWRQGWGALLPIDGEVYTGTIFNPSNALFNVTTEWLWVYVDAAVSGSGNAYSLETTPIPNASHAAGLPGNTGTGNINTNQAANSGFFLDPTTLTTTSGGNGVNQFCVGGFDDSTALLPLAVEIAYSPQYLWPL